MGTDGPTNRPTNRPTNIVSYRGACSHLKKGNSGHWALGIGVGVGVGAVSWGWRLGLGVGAGVSGWGWGLGLGVKGWGLGLGLGAPFSRLHLLPQALVVFYFPPFFFIKKDHTVYCLSQVLQLHAYQNFSYLNSFSQH